MCYLKEVWTIIRSIKYRAEAGTYLKLLENFGLVYYLVRDIKPPNHDFCSPQLLSRNFFSLTSSFSTAQTEKFLWKKLGKTRFVVWWFDVTNKILLQLICKIHQIYDRRGYFFCYIETCVAKTFFNI